jgi:hypothetical protein
LQAENSLFKVQKITKALDMFYAIQQEANGQKPTQTLGKNLKTISYNT